MINYYRDAGRSYLQLHALRAPVGKYLPEYENDNTLYDRDVQSAVEDFEVINNVTVYQLGRSGRHICIDDTARNRRRYASLSRKAVAAATALWATMRATD